MPVRYVRDIQLLQIAEKRSFFLFGPRQTGKSTLLKALFPSALYFDLLSKKTEELFTRSPEKLEQMAIASKTKQNIIQIIIDEVPRAPHILNEVHRLIEEHKEFRFILTGSSTRKLHQARTNMLGGRASLLQLCPITFNEFVKSGDTRDPIQTLVQWGGLPPVLNSNQPKEILKDYIQGYIYGEIRSETNVRSLDNYARFLDSAALMNSEQINFSDIASDAQLPVQTVRNYFQILEDTLLGGLLPPYRRTKKRKAVTVPKFYLFDVGITNALLSRWEIKPGTPEYGNAFEQMLWRELTSYISYYGTDFELFYWRTKDQRNEVDFIVQQKGSRVPSCAIEVKAKNNILEKEQKGVLAFSEEFPKIRKIIVSFEPKKRITPSDLEIWPVVEFLAALWAGEIF